MATFDGTVLAVRAVGAEFARRIFIPVLIIAVIIAAAVTGGALYLTTISPWWWVLAAVVILWDMLFALLFTAGGFIIRALNPRQNLAQRKSVRSFVDKLQSLSEVTQTPKFILLFRVVKDIVSKEGGGFIESTVGDTVSLKKEFTDIARSF